MIEIALKDKTPELMQKVEAATGRFVRKAAFYLTGEMKSSMSGPKSGQSYPRGNGSTHVASAPGESPAMDSSNLTGSIETIVRSSLESTIGTPVEYAPYLEDGTGRMDPRPLWERTAREALPTLENMLADEIRGV